MFRSLLLLLFGIFVAATATGVSAQTIHGRVVDETGQAFPTVLVTLLDEDGETLGALISEEDGVFLLLTGRPGSFQLRIQRFGVPTHTTERFDLAVGEERTMTFAVPRAPLLLEGVEVDVGPAAEAAVPANMRILSTREIDEMYSSVRSIGEMLALRFTSRLESVNNGPYGETIRMRHGHDDCGSPHFVVDGVPTPPLDALSISARDVASIEVLGLSDGGRTAFYGFRGDCGVIEIRTRR